MTTKFIYIRSYTFTPEKGRNMFFELIKRSCDKVAFRLRDKDNTEVIETDLQSEDGVECCNFVCKGKKVDLYAHQFIPKGVKTPRVKSEAELREWMQTREDALKDATVFSIHNREEIEASTECGCYCCQRIFPSTAIEKWTDNGTTAICPYCGTDAVIPNIRGIIRVTPTLLTALNQKYF